MEQELMNRIDDLEEVTHLLKSVFVGKDEFIELMVVCAISQEHLLVVGPPGTAKSELVKRFSLLCSRETAGNGKVPYFEYLFTRFTEPNEIFGPVDIRAFQQGGGHRRITDGLLPVAEMAFLDEVFKANSAILNALLALLNERVFYNGSARQSAPLICAIGATNEVPDDPALAAMFDRFLVRVWSDNVEEARFGELFEKGWKLERQRIQEGYGVKAENLTTTDDLRAIHRALYGVEVGAVAGEYREAVRRIRAEGVALSDRRVIKLLKLAAASALRRKSLELNTGDFWVLRHVWNRPEQIPHLQAVLNPYLEGYEGARWSAERSLERIGDDIRVLEERQGRLRTDADFADFLQEAERLRRELSAHSDRQGRAPTLRTLEELIDNAMNLLESAG